MPRQNSVTPVTNQPLHITRSRYFHELTLLQAERVLVGAAIDDADALLCILGSFPADFFRSEGAEDLRVPFYAVTGWWADGTYDEMGNRYQLEALGVNVDECECPMSAVLEYVRDLCAAVAEYYRLWDARVEAALAWRDANPLYNGQPPVRKTAQRGRVAQGGRWRGGVE